MITYRGLGPDAPEHIIMGKSCENLLKEVGMKTFVPDQKDLEASLDAAVGVMDSNKDPVAIFIKKGIFGG